jgi:hypothetical protein
LHPTGPKFLSEAFEKPFRERCMKKLSLSIAALGALAVSSVAFAQGASEPMAMPAAGASSTTASSYSPPTTVHKKKPKHKMARKAHPQSAASAASE